MTSATDKPSKTRLSVGGQAYIGGSECKEERKTVGNCMAVPSFGSNPHIEPYLKNKMPTPEERSLNTPKTFCFELLTA
jgi:hypothetical protein